MTASNPDIDRYLAEGCYRCKLGGTPECKVHDWQDQLRALRRIALESGLTEELKWKVPCYTHKGKNVATVAAFKEFCSINFFKGVLLKDDAKLLVAAGENSQAARQARFTEASRIEELADVLKAYFQEAMKLEEDGKKVTFKKSPEPMPEELQAKLDEMPELKKAFEKLTPGRQRGYILYVSGAKQSATRTSRVEKNIDKILRGEGIHDQYKNC